MTKLLQCFLSLSTDDIIDLGEISEQRIAYFTDTTGAAKNNDYFGVGLFYS